MNEDKKFLLYVIIIMLFIILVLYSTGFFESPRKEYCNKFCNDKESDFRVKKMSTFCKCYNEDGSYVETEVDIKGNL